MKTFTTSKILFIHHGQVIGGAPTSLKNTVIGLKKEGFDNLKILCAFPDMKLFFQKEAVVETSDIYSPHLLVGRVFVGLASLMNLRTFIYFWLELLKAPLTIHRQISTFKREKPDIIHLNSSILFIVAISAKIAKIPLLWHVREVVIGSKWNLRKKFTGWFIRKLADRVICISELEAKSLGNNTFDNVEVVYNFVDFSEFRCSNMELNEIIQEYNPENKKVYVSLGGVSFRKGTVEIIELAKKIPNELFLIAGTCPTKNIYGKMKKSLITYVHKFEDVLKKYRFKNIYSWYYTQRVEFLYLGSKLANLQFIGKLDNVTPLIAMSDGLIFAGCTPHFPRPVYEAWAVKKPVVVFDMEGISEHITNGIDGIICKSNSAAGLQDGLQTLNLEMGEKGYKKAISRFDMEKNVKKIISVYMEL